MVLWFGALVVRRFGGSEVEVVRCLGGSQVNAGQDKTRKCKIRDDKHIQDKTRQAKRIQDTARQEKTRQYKTR